MRLRLRRLRCLLGRRLGSQAPTTTSSTSHETIIKDLL
jgi:hypothetical protein